MTAGTGVGGSYNSAWHDSSFSRKRKHSALSMGSDSPQVRPDVIAASTTVSMGSDYPQVRPNCIDASITSPPLRIVPLAIGTPVNGVLVPKVTGSDAPIIPATIFLVLFFRI